MFKEHVLLTLRRLHLTRRQLAKLTGIPYVCLCSYLRKPDGSTLTERLYPYFFGDKQRDLLALAKEVS